jgi:hypothetical protein
MIFNKIFVIFGKTINIMYSINNTYGSRLQDKPKTLSQMTKAEKESRAREMNAEYAKTATTKRSKGKKVQGGVKLTIGQKLFGGKQRSTASDSSNPLRAAKQKAREKGKEQICGPSGCMTRKKMERKQGRPKQRLQGL